MPLYEYQCRDCKAHYEKIRKFSDPPLTKCEKCGGRLEQLLSSPAFQFKGSGWYITDYARKSGAPASEPSKSEKSDNGDSKKSTEAASGKETPKTPTTPAATK